EPVPAAQPVAAAPEEPLPKGVVAVFGGLHYRTPHAVTSSTLSSDGKLLAVAGMYSVRGYEAATWRAAGRFMTDGPGVGAWATGGNMAFSRDSRYLGYARNGQTAYVWDLRSGKQTNRFDGEEWRWTNFCSFTPDGLFALSDKDRLYFYDP